MVAWINHQVNVIGHEAVAKQPAAKFHLQFRQVLEVEEIVGILIEHVSAVVTAVNQVMRIVGKDDPSGAGHA